MFNYYLYQKSYESARAHEIEANLRYLNDLVLNNDASERFLKHDSIWETPTADGDFADVVFAKMEDRQFGMTVLPKLFNAIDSLDHKIGSLEEFDALYQSYNAFYGVHFESDDTRCISDPEDYQEFKNKYLWDVTPESLWARREQLFQKLVLCPSVENDLKDIGKTFLNPIIAKLKEFDRYVQTYWKSGAFSVKDANLKTTLNVSHESKKTMEVEHYYNQRVFMLPDGTKECFEMHVKLGVMRFHFLPRNGRIYIGFIGKHLNTARFS
ncbi:MAG: hypothetical protein LBR06_06755 [Bacteroidales bacterium]|jgi:hypothetical protein|nr:hypothetical protein [Bacteroidales bacterium]